MFSRQTFTKSGYQMFQVMRFAVEEINNSTTLLPNVTLGYEVFDHCSDTKNFPSVFSFISQNGLINPKEKLNNHQSKVIALTGPYGSTRALAVAPLVTMNYIPWVQYAAATSVFSDKLRYPTLLRTIPSNKDLVQMLIHIIQWFGWNWVAFIGGADDYSKDGLNLFYKYTKNTGICVAYQELLKIQGNYNQTLKNINMLNINVIVVFTVPLYAESVMKAAIANNIRDKVWISSHPWSMNQQLLKEPGIEKVGTIIGITERITSLPGFDQFVYKMKATNKHNNGDVEVPNKICNQECKEGAFVSAVEIINENPTYSFNIYAAIYSIAHALHTVLQCNLNECRKNLAVKPYMLLGELKKLDFPLNGRQVKFDVNGNPTISYAVALWHTETNHSWIEMVGTYDTYPETILTINNSLMPWRNNTSVPFSNCSVECMEGYSREHEGLHSCCFRCKKCPQNTYVDYSRDPYTCFPCAESEWSDEGSTTCKTRTVVYLQFTDIASILVIFSTVCLIALLIFIFCLFAYNYNTPVVRSAGGNMCFLMLACLTMSSISVFFFFGQPTSVHCVLRNFIFTFFFTICLSCLTVRSFQIVCVFKMAAEFPKLHSLWTRFIVLYRSLGDEGGVRRLGEENYWAISRVTVSLSSQEVPGPTKGRSVGEPWIDRKHGDRTTFHPSHEVVKARRLQSIYSPTKAALAWTGREKERTRCGVTPPQLAGSGEARRYIGVSSSQRALYGRRVVVVCRYIPPKPWVWAEPRREFAPARYPGYHNRRGS
ncbi:taste receptor type 1 member 1-like [Paramisgurnus dabryanus]|uniref:taste receptor type 1 member 1-like n=1 Tax=Paramisgurnus dabryanus TaxID=90735 RepID=UPI0031F39964